MTNPANASGSNGVLDAPKPQRPLSRKSKNTRAKASKLCAYDLETTRIEAGTPRPLYLSLCDESRLAGWPIKSIAHLGELIRVHMLAPEYAGTRFVAWNGNNFDAYFIAASIIQTSDDYIIRPYLTKSKNMRGFRVLLREDFENNETGNEWEFLDGIAMLGLVGTTLDKFLATFAPEYRKLDAPNWDEEDFDYKNEKHVAYALRDSEGLFHGMRRAENILIENFNERLGSTMGSACIKIFQSHIPANTVVHPLNTDQRRIIRQYLMRGGYCYAARKYSGLVWKYDINQAYAAAMRDCDLPAGYPEFVKSYPKYARVWAACVSIRKKNNIVPVYCISELNPRRAPEFAMSEANHVWLTCHEIEQLRAEDWDITFHRFIQWGEHFRMTEYVRKLEHIRTTCEGGPKGATGTMVKAVGNHSYGKSLESIESLEILMAKECPSGFTDYKADELGALPHLWMRQNEPELKPYHMPHIGAFITSHVRMVLRRAIMLAPQDWLYADTDCVIFSSDQTARMDIDASRYGAWKLEESGGLYHIITKKVYYSEDFDTKAAKGLNVKRLTKEQFQAWRDGTPPVQDQVQKNNFLQVMRGAAMYRDQRRRGTAV